MQGSEPARNRCAFIEYCDYLSGDHPAGAVCRAYSGCAVDGANAMECREDAEVACGTVARPFWFCDRQSTSCVILP